MSSPLSIAVLGAGGFLGSHLVNRLLAEGHQVLATDLHLDRLPTTHRNLTMIQGDISDPWVLDRGVAGATLVLSLSAVCTPALYNQQPLAVIDANYTDLVPLVRRCAERRLRLVHFSTCEVYGRDARDAEGASMLRMHEDDTALLLGSVAQQRWSYACAKQLLERVIWGYGKRDQLEFTIVRPFNVIGARMDFIPGVDGEGIPRVLASFLAALLRGEPLRLVGGGQQRRSFVAVEEFVDGISRIVERPASVNGQIINLGNPNNEISIRELAELLSAEYQRQVPNAGPLQLLDVTAEDFYGEGYDDTVRRIPDIEKARRLLDWQPKATLGEVLPAIVADYIARYATRVRAH
jgi:UDP-apiose/xylose synthase